MQQQPQQQVSQIKETLKLECLLPFHDNILSLKKMWQTLQETTLDILVKTGMNTPRINIP